MIIEPILIELDKPRKFLLRTRSLLAAQREINKMRGGSVHEVAAIDYLMAQALKDNSSAEGGFYCPMDIFISLLWAGLLEDDPTLTVDRCADLLDVSPLPRGRIVGMIWDHYLTTTRKSVPNGVDKEAEEKAVPLELNSGSTSGALQ